MARDALQVEGARRARSADQTAFIRNNGIANEVPSFTILSNRCVHLGCPDPARGSDRQGRFRDDPSPDAWPVTLIPTEPSGFVLPVPRRRL